MTERTQTDKNPGEQRGITNQLKTNIMGSLKLKAGEVLIICVMFSLGSLISCTYQKENTEVPGTIESRISDTAEFFSANLNIEDRVKERPISDTSELFRTDLYNEDTVLFKKRLKPSYLYQLRFTGNIDWAHERVLTCVLLFENQNDKSVQEFEFNLASFIKYDYFTTTLFQSYTKSEYQGWLKSFKLRNGGIYKITCYLNNPNGHKLNKALLVCNRISPR